MEKVWAYASTATSSLESYIQELSEIDPEWEEKYAVTDDLVSLKFMIYIYSHANAWTENSCLLLV